MLNENLETNYKNRPYSVKIERRTIKVVHVICEKSKFIVFLFSANPKIKKGKDIELWS